MKQLLFCSLLLLILACDNPPKMQLTGDIDGLKKGTLLLQKIEDSALVSIDSLVVDGDANFKFSVAIESPEVFYLTLRFNDTILNDERVAVFGEAKEMQVQSKLENFEIENQVSGSANHEKWDAYKQLMKRYKNQNLALIEKQLNAYKSANDSLINAINLEQQRLLGAQYLATINFAKNHSDYELAPYLMLTEAYDAQVKYHDTIYNVLTPKIKDSKYGKQLESFIKSRKKATN